VVTLTLYMSYKGAAKVITNAYPITPFPDSFSFWGQGYIAKIIPVPAVIMLITIVIFYFISNRTVFGRSVYSVGGNEEAARLSGVRVRFYKALAYSICGLTSALGAIILTARLNAAESIAGMGYELDVIAAVVIGGTSLMGGRGGVWGTLIGALLIGTINNGMNLLMISSYYQLVVKGVIIVAAVLLDRLREA